MLSSQPLEVGTAKSAVVQALHWARCHPGVLLFGSLALAALFAKPRVPETIIPERRTETEADMVDGDDPLFV